ncbi:DUF6454 family protein [Arenibaculum pallidiluteum]|uniref:DUF6454 family protein n=1 Tax=Arenibaculum pallidiluteum TaxID=2812559 RepID=UPI001A970172|nr:DUF6454 family protein [Arenibaculum pallidiluteum]
MAGHAKAGIAGVALLALATLLGGPPGARAGDGAVLSERFRSLTGASEWRRVSAVPVPFATHHPQGFAKVGDALFVSSVEIVERTQRFPQPVDGMDRSAGKGAGHLFKMDLEGRLLGQITLGEGDIYHPGGIDYDGRHLWVPVAEYRPNSRSIVYRVDPQTLEAVEVFRFPDHIGGIVHDTEDGTLHGVSWGSRRFYTWKLGGDGRSVSDAGVPPEKLMKPNPSFYVDYQDCQYAGRGQALCFGLAEYRTAPGAPAFSLGGMEQVDLRAGSPLHQVPLRLWTENGTAMSRNPVELEATDTGIRAYFMPEDDRSHLFVYETGATR